MDIINIKDKSGKLYYVGGVVRDFILGCESLDVDLTYEGDAIEFAEKNGLDIVQINEPFGTVRVRVDGREVDIASTRKEIYERKGHLPVVTEIGVSLKEDVKRRDFTINTLAMPVQPLSAFGNFTQEDENNKCEVIDFIGGIEDLKNKTIRVLHDESFIDDPTRILRALKFSMRFGFSLDEHTKELQEKYLENVNYNMCYKRVKKELIETFDPHSNICKCSKTVTFSPSSSEGRMQNAFETFINYKIYKLVTSETVCLPAANIENLICEYGAKYVWLVYAGVLGDLSRLPLTKYEQKILDDFEAVKSKKFSDDFEIYKAFDNVKIETVLLYAVLVDETLARHYLDDLRHIKLSIAGADLQKIGIKPSPKYSECFDYVLKQKLKNPSMTKEEELEAAVMFFEC